MSALGRLLLFLTGLCAIAVVLCEMSGGDLQCIATGGFFMFGVLFVAFGGK